MNQDFSQLIGVHFDYPESDYRAAPGICQSDIKECELSLLHYHTKMCGPRSESTDDQVIGTLTHALVLCGREDFVVIPDDAPKKPTKAQINAKKPSEDAIKAIAWWKAFSDDNTGKEHLTKAEAENIRNMRDAVLADPVAASILSRKGNNEVACWKVCPRTGLLLRGRADRLCVDDNNFTTIPDLKTVAYGGGGRKKFSKQIRDWGYHVQGAFYLDLFEATYFVFIVVEKEPPYAVSVYPLGQRSLLAGRRKYHSYLDAIKQAQETGIWPGYPQSMEPIDLPEWELKDLE